MNENRTILITGGTGLIGTRLTNKLLNEGYNVTLLTRKIHRQHITSNVLYLEWDYYSSFPYTEELKKTLAIIHLAGANVAEKRWDDKYKKEILASRIEPIKRLRDAVSDLEMKPEVFISSSGINFYGDRGAEQLDESSDQGSGFLTDVTVQWEKETSMFQNIGVRAVSLRTGVVLSPDSGALKKMLTPFKFFVGGPLGNGRQYFSWIDIADVVNMYVFALKSKSLTGAFNAVAPNPVTMNEFAETLGKVMRRPSFIKVPAVALKLLLGEVAVEILGSQRVIPTRMLEAGFQFTYSTLEASLRHLLNK